MKEIKRRVFLQALLCPKNSFSGEMAVKTRWKMRDECLRVLGVERIATRLVMNQVKIIPVAKGKQALKKAAGYQGGATRYAIINNTGEQTYAWLGHTS